MAVLLLNSHAKDEATESKQSDTIFIRSAQRLAMHLGFVQSCRSSAFRPGNYLSLLSAGHVHIWKLQPTSLLEPKSSPGSSQSDFSLADISEWFNTNGRTVCLRKWTFWLACTGIWPGQRDFSSVLASSIIRKLTRLLELCISVKKGILWSQKKNIAHGRTCCSTGAWRNSIFS